MSWLILYRTTVQEQPGGATFSGNAIGLPAAISGIADGNHVGPVTFELGTTTVSFNGTDAATNTAIPCSFTVTVVDTAAPVVTCPSNMTAGNDHHKCHATVTYTATSSDNCSGVSHVQIAPLGLVSGDEFPKGTTSVTFEATDAAGNTASCSFDVTVNDTQKPWINCPNTKTAVVRGGLCKAEVQYRISSGDNCSEEAMEGLVIKNYAVGVHYKTHTVSDPSGNTNSCTVQVTVVDNTHPTVNCPADIIIGNDLGLCGAIVNYTVTSDDNCTVSHEQTGPSGLVSGDEFPLGITSQTYTAADASGNTAMCSFNVTINDNEQPVFSCPSSNVVRNTDLSTCEHLAVGNDLDPQVTDNCQVQSVVNDLTNTSSLAGERYFPKEKPSSLGQQPTFTEIAAFAAIISKFATARHPLSPTALRAPPSSSQPTPQVLITPGLPSRPQTTAILPTSSPSAASR